MRDSGKNRSQAAGQVDGTGLGPSFTSCSLLPQTSPEIDIDYDLNVQRLYALAP